MAQSKSRAAQTTKVSKLPVRQGRRVTADLRAETAQLSAGALSDEERQRHPEAFAASRSSEVPPIDGASLPGDTNPLAPPVSPSFDAINFNEDANLNGFFHIPPDPAGAAGPAHVVNVVNTSIEWYTKAGVRQNRQRLDNFFASLTPVNNTFDPKVIYDQYQNRFLVVTLERNDTGVAATSTSRLLLAVSDDSDPNGTWFFHAINGNQIIGGNPSFADFPGFAVDSEAIYITINQFRFSFGGGTGAGRRLYLTPKAPFYTGGAATTTVFDPEALANANPLGDGAVPGVTLQPTQMYGDTPGGVGTYLVGYSGINGGGLLFVEVIQIDNPLSATPTFTGNLSQWGTVAANDNTAAGFPGAPQSGTTRTIATNDRRVSQNGVLRNGSLYFAAPILPPAASPADANQVTVHYFQLDTATLSLPANTPPVDQGNIGGEDIAAGTFTFFPSVAVDSANNLAVGFAASAPSIFPGAYYTGRLAVAAPGTTQPAAGLRAGRDFYIRDLSTSTTVASRWGDYTGIWLDPADEASFWVFNEYALPRGTILGGLPEEDGRWGTAWGKFSLGAPATPAAAGSVIISEFRLRGPDPDGAGALDGARDEFIELYNTTSAPIVVNDATPVAGANGWALVASDNVSVARAIVPTGTIIPARGHYLIANNTAPGGYSLGAYPAGNNGIATTTATPDLTYATNIPDNIGIALFNTANPAGYTLVNRLDAVGSTAEANVFYKEGAGYPVISPFDINYSFFRDLSTGLPKDTNDNASDFLFVDPGGTSAGAGQRLGAPGPENLSSPIQRNGTIKSNLLDPLAASTASPNRSRETTPNNCNGGTPAIACTFGTLEFRRRYSNTTGANVTRLRFRIVDITTFLAPAGTADLRVLTSPNLVVALTGGAGNVTVLGTTLETPPLQPNGGGYNSTLSAGTVTLAAPLVPGATINIRLLTAVQQTGTFRFFINVEALP